ncbi:MAG: isoprenylcysteine carboxylmethyltransferase family protein [Bacteroidia bacterium]|nr:isoprenylcysteine carboxylmethyltransferase family protein [Bacteroidia bacterium]
MIFPIIVWSAWFISEILLTRMFRSDTADKKNQDKGSISIIWITIGIANTAGILCSIFLNMPVSHSAIVSYIGLSLIIIGMIIRFFSVWSLGRFFTVDVTIRENHKLKADGIYRLVRHPSYTGSILSFVGFGISINNWISILVISIPVTLAILYRIKIEERLLSNQFGSDYSDYIQRSYRLIPWIY